MQNTAHPYSTVIPLQIVLADPCTAATALQLQPAADMRAFKCVRIDGTISSSSERQARIAKFNADISIEVFLLTTQCGGVGITLNGADRVVIFDPAWNPAVACLFLPNYYNHF